MLGVLYDQTLNPLPPKIHTPPRPDHPARKPGDGLGAARRVRVLALLWCVVVGGGMRKLQLLDLFSGLGGFSLGLERSGGFETVAFCEIEEFPRRILAKHWPEVPCYHDVTKLTADALQRDGIAVDVISAGFPCQDLSVAGKRAGIEGERSGLWSEVVRLSGELRPKLIFLENVSALLSGKSEYEHPNDRCVCGWPYRWRGLHWDTTQKPQIILPKSGRRHDGKGQASFGQDEGDLRRHSHQDTQADRKVGSRVDMATVRKTIGGFSGGYTSSFNLETRTSDICHEVAGLDQLTAEEAEWLSFVDAGGNKCGESDSTHGDGVECQGAAENTDSWRVCPSCGRDLDNTATRSGVTTWMGRVLGDLASLGYDAEWHCIPASAVGAPHRRDRVWIIAYPEGQRCRKAGIIRREQLEEWFSCCSKTHDASDHGAERIQGIIPEASYSLGSFSWCQNVRGLEDLRERSDLPEPIIRGTRDGVPDWVDRLKALGNAVVPQIPELLGRSVMEAMPDLFTESAVAHSGDQPGVFAQRPHPESRAGRNFQGVSS